MDGFDSRIRAGREVHPGVMLRWEFRAGFKHLMVDAPARSVCSRASPELIEELIANSDVDVPDTATCWLCLALERKGEGA